MKIEIMSRETLEKITAGPDFQKTAVISIIDSDAFPVHLRFAPDYLLPLCFDDMDPESDLMDELFKEFPEARNSASIITDRQAKKIADFVLNIHLEADRLICQCEFGQSRSAAVAAAVKEFLYGNGSDIFADARYFPNKYVYKKVMEALEDRRPS